MVPTKRGRVQTLGIDWRRYTVWGGYLGSPSCFAQYLPGGYQFFRPEAGSYFCAIVEAKTLR